MKAVREHIISDFSNAESINNFRLTANGTLEKREGFSRIDIFDLTVRGAVSSEYTTYIVSGNGLYSVSEYGTAFLGDLVECQFSDDTEKAEMFIESGCVYIVGGGGFYKYTPEKNLLSEVSCYIPLIRIKAGSSTVGEEYEERNLVSPRVRISVSTTDTDDSIQLWGKSNNVVAAYVNDKEISKEKYSISYRSNGDVYVRFLENYSAVADELFVEYDLNILHYPLMRKQFFSQKKAYVHREGLKNRLFLYGDNDGAVLTSEFGAFQTAESEMFGYFTESSLFLVGDGLLPPISMQSLNTRTVIMTKSSILELTASNGSTSGGVSTKKFSTKLVTPEMGIGENSGIILYEDELYFLNENGLYKFAYNAETFEYYAIRIDFADYCMPHHSDLTKMSLFLLRSRHELWCVHPEGAFVYSLRFKCWFTYSGFNAVGQMLLHMRNAAFYSDNALYGFIEGSTKDIDAGFDAEYVSKPIDLGDIFAEKTIYGVGAAFDRVKDAKLMCTLENDKGRKISTELKSEDAVDPTPIVLRSHMRLGRSKYLICRLLSPADAAPANIRSIMFRFRESGGRK